MIPMRLLLPVLLTFLVLGCATEESVVRPDLTQPLASMSLGRGGTIGLPYDLSVDIPAGAVSLRPSERSTAAIGDDLALDLGATLRTLCADCFQVTAWGLSADQEIWLDLTVRHPFPAGFPREQYEVFDVRAIVLIPLGDAVFPMAPPSRIGIVATDHLLMPNTDGYTPHFGERTPGFFRSTIHPFKWFFTEDNPDPLVVGTPIPDRRMSYGASDTQRLTLVPQGGSLKTVIVLEAHYVEAADNALPPDDPGGFRNPVFFLPEGHLDEPFRVDIGISGNAKRDEVRDITFSATIADWQQGATVDPAYPTLAQPDRLQGSTGNIATVGLEIPVFDFFSETADTSTGTGTVADPRIDSWVVTTDPTTQGVFPYLIYVVDDRQPTDLTGLTSNDDIRAFRVGTILIED